jgi:aryl-alcohol dehydrogenase-like predicted oxidoreductase
LKPVHGSLKRMAMPARTLADGTAVSGLSLGAMWFGTRVDEATSFDILDRFVEGGGTLIDTANNYAHWLEGGAGGESETVIGRWLASRGARELVVLSTKVGGFPSASGAGLEGLSAAAIRSALADSLRRLGTDRVDVYWAHIDDRTVALAKTVDAFGSVVEAGLVGVLGASNHATWRVERARGIARARSQPGYSCLQLRYSYLQPRLHATLPHLGHLHATEETLDYVRNEPDLSLWVYNSLLAGGYTRPDKPVQEAYDHPGSTRRMAALRDVARATGATPNQVVLAWLLGQPRMIPIVGVSSVAQLDEAIEATKLELDRDHRERLDSADPCPPPG